ncbi:MAG: aminotransferase class IV family protein [Burkholderiaceae bacterium]|nr:aminotransferase class IV family protein [Burkholderiaceae bacterium]
MNTPVFFTRLIDGHPASASELAALAFAGHAHFTAMQVRGGRVRGLDLHLQRLRQASLELFGQALPDSQVRDQWRTALAQGPQDVSLTATVYSPAGEFTAADAAPRMLVRTSAPASGPEGPLRLALFEHERMLPHIKHVGEIAKTHLLRRAVAQGFDDAAFADRHGRISEASIWNLAFWDGEAVVWPRARVLEGTTMAMVRRQLQGLGMAQRESVLTRDDLPSMAGAVVMNSWTAAVPVLAIGDQALPEAPDFVRLLQHALATEEAVAP